MIGPPPAGPRLMQELPSPRPPSCSAPVRGTCGVLNKLPQRSKPLQTCLHSANSTVSFAALQGLHREPRASSLAHTCCIVHACSMHAGSMPRPRHLVLALDAFPTDWTAPAGLRLMQELPSPWPPECPTRVRGTCGLLNSWPQRSKPLQTCSHAANSTVSFAALQGLHHEPRPSSLARTCCIVHARSMHAASMPRPSHCVLLLT